MWLLYVCMYVCMYVVYKLAPHKILSKNIIPKGFGQMLPIMVYGIMVYGS